MAAPAPPPSTCERFSYIRLTAQTAWRPYLNIVLRKGFHTSKELLGLVDSGADYPIFPSDIASELKLDLSHAPTRNFSGTTGKLQLARMADISITILRDDRTNAFEIECLCAFCDDFKFPGGGILGQEGFLARFKATFLQPLNCFELEYWESKRGRARRR